MRVDDYQCFVPCTMTEFKIGPGFLPAAFVVAKSPTPATDRIQR
jgi:hypothetical protein